MRIRPVVALAALLALGALSPAAKEPEKRTPVAVTLDMNEVMKQSKLAQQLEARLNGLGESIQAQLAPMEEQLKLKKANFQGNQDAFTPEQRTLEMQAIQKMEQQLQEAQRQAQEAYGRQRDSLGAQWRQALDPVVAALAGEKGWDMVFTRPGGDLLWAATWLDATALVVERLNAQFEEEAKKAAKDAPPPTPPAGETKGK